MEEVGAYQHRVLKDMVREDIEDLRNGKPCLDEVRMAMEVETKSREPKAAELEEVWSDMDLWWPAFQKEYISAIEYEQMEDGIAMETLPVKAVATQKPSKLKARLAVCGKYAELAPEGEVSHDDTSPGTQGRDPWMEPAILAVTGAFLQAPRRT